jgi:hypothetical protein
MEDSEIEFRVVSRDKLHPRATDSFGILPDLQSCSSATFNSDFTSDDLLPPNLTEDSYRSAESNAFLTNHVLSSTNPSLGDSTSSLPLQAFENDDDDDEDGDEEVDLEGYTLKIRGQIIDFFAGAAQQLNDLIDARAEISAPKDQEEPEGPLTADEILADAKIEAQVKENKKVYDHVYRGKIVEYLSLIKESIRALQAEEEQLLKYCSTMYPSTCE